MLAQVPAVGEPAARVRRALAERAFRIVYQPIMELDQGHAVAVEALSRFTAEPYRPPDVWFADAWQVGMGADLELAAFQAALANAVHIPYDCRIAINLSPSVIAHPDLMGHLAAAGASRVVVELTEHVAVHDYDRVRSAVAVLREAGAKLAVDDMGSGYASFRHIVQLAPDVIKLDRELVHSIDIDPARRSVAKAMVRFASEVGSVIVAEGIETPAELQVVQALGIRYGQGMLIGAPEPVEVLPIALRLGTVPWWPTHDGGGGPLPSSPVDRWSEAGSRRAGSRTTGAVSCGQLVSVSHALAGLAEAAVRGDLDAEPAEVTALDEAASVMVRIAARRNGGVGGAPLVVGLPWG